MPNELTFGKVSNDIKRMMEVFTTEHLRIQKKWIKKYGLFLDDNAAYKDPTHNVVYMTRFAFNKLSKEPYFKNMSQYPIDTNGKN